MEQFFRKLFRTPSSLPVDKTLCTAGNLLLAIRPTPRNLHFCGHGNHIIGFQFCVIVAELAIASFNGDGLVVRATCEVRRFLEIVAQAVAGAVIPARAAGAEELRDEPGNERLKRRSTRSDKR